jgi:hypothetical protein
MSRVFIFAPQDGRFNIDSAAAYGEVIPAYPEGVSPFNTDCLVDRLFETIESFEPDSDFIAMTGNNIVVALAVALALSSYGRLRLLIFDARTSKYVERSIHDPAWSNADE